MHPVAYVLLMIKQKLLGEWCSGLGLHFCLIQTFHTQYGPLLPLVLVKLILLS